MLTICRGRDCRGAAGTVRRSTGGRRSPLGYSAAASRWRVCTAARTGGAGPSSEAAGRCDRPRRPFVVRYRHPGTGPAVTSASSRLPIVAAPSMRPSVLTMPTSPRLRPALPTRAPIPRVKATKEPPWTRWRWQTRARRLRQPIWLICAATSSDCQPANGRRWCCATGGAPANTRSPRRSA